MSTVTNFLTPAQRAANLLLETTENSILRRLDCKGTEIASWANPTLVRVLEQCRSRHHLNELLDAAIGQLTQMKSDLQEATQFKAKVFTAPQSPEGAA